MEDEREERETPEPSLVERAEQPHEEQEPEEERPSDFALGVMLNDLKTEVAGLKGSHENRLSSLEAGLASMPEQMAEALENAIQALQDDSHGEAPDETPLAQNPGLKWWEKVLGGRN